MPIGGSLEFSGDSRSLDHGRRNTIMRRLLFSSIVFLALVLRLALLARDGLWADECQSLFIARFPLSTLVDIARDETQAPAYILLIKFLTRVFGESTFVVRLPSALFGTAAVALSWFAARRLISPAAAPLAAFLIAVSPMAVHYSQEARAYGPLQFFVLAALLLTSRLEDSWSWRTASALVAVFLIMLYTHNISLFFVAGIAAGSLIAAPTSRDAIRRWSIVTTLTVLGFLPWVRHLLVQLDSIATVYAWAAENWRTEFPWQVVRSLAAMTHGSLTPIRNHTADILPSAWIALTLCALLVIAALAYRQRLPRPQSPVLLVTALTVSLGAQFIYCWVAQTPSYTVGRNDAPALPLLILLVSAGCVTLPGKIRWLAPVAFAGLAFQPLLIHYSFDFRSQEQNLARYLAEVRHPDEVVVTTAYDYSVSCLVEDRLGDVHLIYPSQRERRPSWRQWPESGLDGARADAKELIVRAIETSRSRNQSRIWLVRLREDPLADIWMEAANPYLDLIEVIPQDPLRSDLLLYRIPDAGDQ